MSPDGRARTPEVSHLLDQLRKAKARSGLSFAALGARTDYSKSSWERYLNGKALPPRQAVAALARLADMPPTRLLALWDLADRAWSGRDGYPSVPPDVPGSVPPGPGPGLGPGPDPSPDLAATRVAVRPDASPAGPDPSGTTPDAAPDAPTEPGALVPGGVRRRWLGRAEWVAGGAALGLMVAVAVWATGSAGDDRGDPAADPTPTVVSGPCHGTSCTGRDSDTGETGCWMDAATHATREIEGRTAELRVSGTCAAAWARLVEPRAGDELWIEAGDRRQSVQASAANRYLLTMMLGIERPAEARVCFALADGTAGCTTWGSQNALPR
ncbi:helix-turn-helix domain-containing protein [Streptomyces sp. B6B3]|uniref:helix-turn-helix domain-containing protein n=1 Tax=Streptomyces sp. B6B3 TaxID=3153570 RepID=UPI00325F5C9D